MGWQLSGNCRNFGLTLPPCPFRVVGMPYPDFLYIFGSIIVSVVVIAAVHADNLSNRQIKLAPLVATIRTSLTGWFPSTNDNKLAPEFVWFGLTHCPEFSPSSAVLIARDRQRFFTIPDTFKSSKAITWFSFTTLVDNLCKKFLRMSLSLALSLATLRRIRSRRFEFFWRRDNLRCDRLILRSRHE